MLLWTHFLPIWAKHFSLIILFFFFVYIIQFISLLFAVQTPCLLCITVSNSDLLKNKQKINLWMRCEQSYYIHKPPFVKMNHFFSLSRSLSTKCFCDILLNSIEFHNPTLALRMPRLTLPWIWCILWRVQNSVRTESVNSLPLSRCKIWGPPGKWKRFFKHDNFNNCFLLRRTG